MTRRANASGETARLHSSDVRLFTFITAGPYHEFIEAAEAAIPVVGYLYHVSFYVRGQC